MIHDRKMVCGCHTGGCSWRLDKGSEFEDEEVVIEDDAECRRKRTLNVMLLVETMEQL